MKFHTHKFWRHANSLDVFFSVSSIVFDDDGKNAILNGWWCTQSQNAWWFTMNARLKIGPEQYQLWYQYEPYGELKL